jgi:protein-L-isoaspartate O-methyltransferase
VAELREGGRLVVPVDQPDRHQQLKVLTHHADGDFLESVLACAFVPMVGKIRKPPESDQPQ